MFWALEAGQRQRTRHRPTLRGRPVPAAAGAHVQARQRRPANAAPDAARAVRRHRLWRLRPRMCQRRAALRLQALEVLPARRRRAAAAQPRGRPAAHRCQQRARGRPRRRRHAAGTRAGPQRVPSNGGAHDTPRADVERLALPMVVEPLRAHWADAQAAALLLATEAAALDGKVRDNRRAKARAAIKRFHRQRCPTRVPDPACCSGNLLSGALVPAEAVGRGSAEPAGGLGRHAEPPGL